MYYLPKTMLRVQIRNSTFIANVLRAYANVHRMAPNTQKHLDDWKFIPMDNTGKAEKKSHENIYNFFYIYVSLFLTKDMTHLVAFLPTKAKKTFWSENISDVTETLASNISKNSTKNNPNALRDPMCRKDIEEHAEK